MKSHPELENGKSFLTNSDHDPESDKNYRNNYDRISQNKKVSDLKELFRLMFKSIKI